MTISFRHWLPPFFLLIALTCGRADDILFIGNSYTQAAGSKAAAHGGVPKLVEEIAAAKGKQVTSGMLAVGGKDWTYFLSLPATDPKLASMPWNWVVLQDHSDKPSKNPTGFQQEGDAIADRIAKDAPTAGLVLYETWARPAVFFKGDASKAEQMEQQDHAAYSALQTELAAKNPQRQVLLAPVGDAFWALEGKGTMNLHFKDNHHANDNGYYLAALVIYGTIYHDTADGAPTSFFNGAMTISPDDAKILQATANAALSAK
jgi:hypothetical protein